MRLINKLLITIILFISIFSYNAFANDGSSLSQSYNPNNDIQVISAYTNGNTPDVPEATSGMDGITAFWNLPVWVQLAYLTIVAASILALLKVMPFVFGRLKHVLENTKTKNIFYYIQNNPGLTIQQLSDEQNINRGTLKYHLSQLFVNNKITLIRRGKVSQLYHNTMSPMDKESIIASYLRRNDNSRSLLFSIMDNPGITNKDLSEKLGLDKSTITDYLKKFLDDDIVEFRHDGKLKRCYMMQDTRLILLRYKPQ